MCFINLGDIFSSFFRDVAVAGEKHGVGSDNIWEFGTNALGKSSDLIHTGLLPERAPSLHWDSSGYSASFLVSGLKALPWRAW